MTLPTSISAEHHTSSFLKIVHSHFYPSLFRATLPTPFLAMTGRTTTKRVLLSLADHFKILRNKLQYPWLKNTHNITEGAYFFIDINHQFCTHNTTQNFHSSSPRTTSHCHVLRKMGKNERVEGQESLYTKVGPAGYLCSAKQYTDKCTVLDSNMKL